MCRGMADRAEKGVVVAQDGSQLGNVVQTLNSHQLGFDELFAQDSADHFILWRREQLVDRGAGAVAHVGSTGHFLQHLREGGLDDEVVNTVQDCQEH